MPEVDLFRIWRLLLLLVGSAYTLVRVVHGLYNWNRRLDRRRRPTAIARKLVVNKLLGIRWRRFAGELALIAVLAAVLAGLLIVHQGLDLFSMRTTSHG
jgi:uncharacterized iron-regulated membrane protein